jgi:2-polyprenyl-3-methyl-5-hydroxy-6-metoxy-1,4-benzoquinol methylase
LAPARLGEGARPLAPLRRWRAIRTCRTGLFRHRYPATPEELRASALAQARWYYSAELLPGVVIEGQYADSMPLLPRLMLRRCQVEGTSCLDIGTMEGLVPILLKRRGARDVLAVDASNHCLGKLAAVQHYHGESFRYRTVGLLYGLHQRIGSQGFDLVHCSGVLYHVFSPLSVLAAIRPLVNRDGLVVISTYVTLDEGPVMDFNRAGRMWAEGNTFWFPAVGLLDYLLRYMRLEPVDCLFMPLEALAGPEYDRLGLNRGFDKPAGYLSVACRAVDRVEADPWMTESMRSSWEWHGLVDWEAADGRPRAEIGHDGETAGLDLDAAVRERDPVMPPAGHDDSYLLRLDAPS